MLVLLGGTSMKEVVRRSADVAMLYFAPVHLLTILITHCFQFQTLLEVYIAMFLGGVKYVQLIPQKITHVIGPLFLDLVAMLHSLKFFDCNSLLTCKLLLVNYLSSI